MDAEARIKKLGIELPPLPYPTGVYTYASRAGDLLFIEGVRPIVDNKLVFYGLIGTDLTIEQGREAARLAALNTLSIIRAYLGSLDRVEKVISVTGFIAASEGFMEHSKVLDGASEVFLEIFGSAGKHTRSDIGVASLPGNAPVMLNVIIKVRD